MTQATYQEVMRLIKKGEITSRSALLDQLAQDTANRQFEQMFDPIKPFRVAIGFDVQEPNEEQRTELIKLLHQLKESGVVNQHASKLLLADIMGNLIERLDVQLFEQAKRRMKVYEWLESKQYDSSVNSLRSTGILSQEGYKRLLQDFKPENINDGIELYKYINRAVVFEPRDYYNSKDPYEYFPKIYTTVAQMLTKSGVANFTMENVNIEIVKYKSSGNHESEKLIVSALVNGRLYQQSILDRDELFTHFFNKILRDLGSPYRLYKIWLLNTVLDLPLLDYTRLGVIALTENQAKAYLEKYYYDIDHDNQLTTARTEEIIKIIEKIGLLNHLKSEQIAANRQNIAHSYFTHSYQVLKAFDNLLVTFDSEYGTDIEIQYKEFTYKFVAASRRKFTLYPLNIDNNNLSFTLNGNYYSTKIDYNSSNFPEPKYLSFIQQVVEQNFPEGKFYPIYQEYVIGYIFITDEQRHVLQQKILVELR